MFTRQPSTELTNSSPATLSRLELEREENCREVQIFLPFVLLQELSQDLGGELEELDQLTSAGQELQTLRAGTKHLLTNRTLMPGLTEPVGETPDNCQNLTEDLHAAGSLILEHLLNLQVPQQENPVLPLEFLQLSPAKEDELSYQADIEDQRSNLAAWVEFLQ